MQTSPRWIALAKRRPSLRRETDKHMQAGVVNSARAAETLAAIG
jgi:hypothetical protein